MTVGWWCWRYQRLVHSTRTELNWTRTSRPSMRQRHGLYFIPIGCGETRTISVRLVLSTTCIPMRSTFTRRRWSSQPSVWFSVRFTSVLVCCERCLAESSGLINIADAVAEAWRRLMWRSYLAIPASAGAFHFRLPRDRSHRVTGSHVLERFRRDALGRCLVIRGRKRERTSLSHKVTIL